MKASDACSSEAAKCMMEQKACNTLLAGTRVPKHRGGN